MKICRARALVFLLPLAATLTAAEKGEGPEALERSVAAMARVGSCSSPTFSPDGRRLAFVSNLSGVPQIWVVATEGGWPEQVTALEDPVGFVAWSPKGATLAF